MDFAYKGFLLNVERHRTEYECAQAVLQYERITGIVDATLRQQVIDLRFPIEEMRGEFIFYLNRDSG